LTHVNATDEAAHQRNAVEKVKAIEATDRLVIGPVLQELERCYRGDYRVIVCGDHNTRCSDGKHTDDLVPLAVFGAGLSGSSGLPFTEDHCSRFAPLTSLDVIPRLVLAPSVEGPAKGGG
jgi:2,3-bisphosphoglycerate-independent phosphoglycerate mutase